MEVIFGGITTLLILVGVFLPFIVACLIHYYKKRLEHQQIMAAIEKGTPLSEIIPPKPAPGPNSIRDITSGIAMLIIAAGTAVIFWFMSGCGHLPTMPFGVLFIIPVVFFGNGVGHLIRGLLQRNLEKKEGPARNGDTGHCVTGPETGR